MPDASPTGATTEARGRAAVAARVTLNAALRTIVDNAKADMQKVVDDAADAVAQLPPAERGKPDDKGKPESLPGAPAEKGRPENPGSKPSVPPGKARP